MVFGSPPVISHFLRPWNEGVFNNTDPERGLPTHHSCGELLTPPKFNSSPLKNGWLEDDPFLLGESLFLGAKNVQFPGCTTSDDPSIPSPTGPGSLHCGVDESNRCGTMVAFGIRLATRRCSVLGKTWGKPTGWIFSWEQWIENWWFDIWVILLIRNPAPVDMENNPCFIGFHRSQVVQDFFHQPYRGCWGCQTWFILPQFEEDYQPTRCLFFIANMSSL